MEHTMEVKRETQLHLTCDFCRRSEKPGYLWLGGKDYVECPQCDGDQRMTILEQVVLPGRIFAVGGRPLTRVEVR